jgi:hypothetical protein
MRVIKFASILFGCFTILTLFSDKANATKITVSGDFSSNSYMQQVIENIGRNHSDVHLAVGDLSYGDNSDVNQETNWCNLVKTKLTSQGIDADTFPFQLLSGNHEDDNPLDGNNGYIMDFADCLPDRMSSTGVYAAHYYFDIDNVRVIMTSPDLIVDGTTYTYSVGSPEYTDVGNWIDEGRVAGKDWIIVATHKNCLSIGKKPTCEIETDLMNLLMTKQVDMVVQGHDHTYQRTKQLSLGSGCTSLVVAGYDSDCTVPQTSSNFYSKGDGTVVVVSGAGGKDLYNINTNDSESSYFLRGMGANASPSYGNLVLDINGETLSGSFSAANGSYVDEFTISDTLNFVNASQQGPGLIGKFDNDYVSDIATARVSGSDVSWRVARSTGSSFSYLGTWISDFGNDGDQFFVGDFTGDGKDDIATARVSGSDVSWRVARSTGRSFSYLGTWISDFGNDGDQFFVGDFTGDGKDDIALSRTENTDKALWRVSASSGGRFIYKGQWRTELQRSADQVQIGDINGDKTEDIVFEHLVDFNTVEVWRSLSSGSGFSSPIKVSADFGNDGHFFRLGNFDGVLADDIVRVASPTSSTLSWRAALFAGNSLFDLGTWSSDMGNPGDLF